LELLSHQVVEAYLAHQILFLMLQIHFLESLALKLMVEQEITKMKMEVVEMMMMWERVVVVPPHMLLKVTLNRNQLT
jgi:hypothetical protein